MNYLLRISIALDAFVQAMFRSGHVGVTISSRVGTAAAHQHAWGKWGCWLLDKTLGKGHCKSAIGNDIQRARAAIKELSDPLVTQWRKKK